MLISLSSLDPIVAARSLLKHPFYVAWSKGELTLDHLRTYAKEYFHLVRRIPGIVARVGERVQDRELKNRIEHNMQEEQEHVELWKSFASSLGVSENELMTHVPSAKTQEAVTTLETLAEHGMEEGIAGMYALEVELPQIAATKKDGLCTFYGLTSQEAHIYFDEHLKEEEHLKVWRQFTLDAERGAKAARTSAAAQNLLLDAVCEECGLSMAC